MQEQESIKKLFKELIKNKNDELKAKQALKQINHHLLDKSFRFTKENTDMLYPYLYLSNKFQVTNYLNKLLDTKEFINLLDSTEISGSMLLSLTTNCHKPRLTLLSSSKKIKHSLLKGDELFTLSEMISDLTPEEIVFLRQNASIDNLLIKNGLSFNTLKPETKEQILNDLSILKVYNLNTIKEFASTCDNPSNLINNETFLNIYLSKLDSNYATNHPLFKYLSLKKLEYILKKYHQDYIILHLLKNTDHLLQKEILRLKNINELIMFHPNYYILTSLPYSYLKKLLVKEPKLFTSPFIDILSSLPVDKLTSIASSNPSYYECLLNNLNKDHLNIKFIEALPSNLVVDLQNTKLPNLDLKTITNLCQASSIYKKSFLKNKALCSKIASNLKVKDYSLLDQLFSLGHFTNDDKILFLSNITDSKNTSLINHLLQNIPLSKRKYFYDNNELRTELVNADNYILDDYAISYYLNNINDIPKLQAPVIKDLLIKTDLNFNHQVLSNKKVTSILLNYAKKDYHLIPEIIQNRPSLIKYFNTESRYYTKELLANILSELDYASKKELCSNELIKAVLKDKYYNIYKKLLNKNTYLLNTIDFRIFEDYICDLKISLLSDITKYPHLQKNLITISKYYKVTSSFINNLSYSLNDLNKYETLDNIFTLLVSATNPKNRKRVGNLPKLIANINYTRLSKKDLTSIISYYLYLIPRLYQNNQSLPRPIILNAPRTYSDILNYETNTVNKLTNLIKTEKHIKEYFLEKHFKLTLTEAEMISKMYDFSYLDTNTYNEEYIFISNLNKILNTDDESLKELDQDYKIISMYDSFRLINQINKMYSKIYNYELRSKNNNLKAEVINYYNKPITIYKSKEDFLYLVANLDLEPTYIQTKSYFTSYHTLLNNHNLYLPCSLLSKDNLNFNSDFLFGYNGMLDEGIAKISNYYLPDSTYLDNTKDYYASVNNLINNTRDYNNTIYLNKYSIRPNYNNENIPNIEPDYMLVDSSRLKDNIYLSKIINISLDFKSKHHPSGLPIIALDLKQISNRELTNIKKLLNEYKTTYEPHLLAKLLTKLENNYTAYRHTNKEESLKYDIYVILNIVIDRINKTNSIYELNSIEEIFTKEYQKYKLLKEDNKCNYFLDNIKKNIANRKNILNNY